MHEIIIKIRKGDHINSSKQIIRVLNFNFYYNIFFYVNTNRNMKKKIYIYTSTPTRTKCTKYGHIKLKKKNEERAINFEVK